MYTVMTARIVVRGAKVLDACGVNQWSGRTIKNNVAL